jgi:pyridoxal 5'-phosphate synthase pdxS subunit
MKEQNTSCIRQCPAQIKRGGVIMDVTTVEQAKIAEKAGAVAVMALERVPADIRASGGVARMADPEMVLRIMEAVSIPVMAKVRIGHFMEARILEELGVDFIDESEVLTPADERYHIDKHAFKVPFVCGARDLGEALRRLAEGAAMLRTKGEPGTGNVVEAVRHMRKVMDGLRRVIHAPEDELSVMAKEMKAAPGLLKQLKEEGRLPVLNYAAGGIATPADAALMMQLGADGIFVGSGIFKSENPQARADAIVQATAHYDDPAVLLKVSKGLGEAMRGLDISSLSEAERMQERGN